MLRNAQEIIAEAEAPAYANAQPIKINSPGVIDYANVCAGGRPKIFPPSTNTKSKSDLCEVVVHGDPICFVGHDPSEMIDLVHHILEKHQEDVRCKEFIISGGVKNYLDGYYYNERLSCNSIYGQAAGFLKHAHGDYDDLAYYVDQQVQGYKFAMRYLRLKS